MSSYRQKRKAEKARAFKFAVAEAIAAIEEDKQAAKRYWPHFEARLDNGWQAKVDADGNYTVTVGGGWCVGEAIKPRAEATASTLAHALGIVDSQVEAKAKADRLARFTSNINSGPLDREGRKR